MTAYLDAADIVRHPMFESAVIKIQNNDESCLTLDEMNAVRHCLKPCDGGEASSNDEDVTGFAARALKKARKDQSESSYIDLSCVRPTSNIAERFFSVSGYAFSDRRKGTHPANLEMQLFLNINQEFWDLSTLHKVMR